MPAAKIKRALDIDKGTLSLTVLATAEQLVCDAHTICTTYDDLPEIAKHAMLHGLQARVGDVDKLVGKERMFFSGVPLNITGGDGMIVRPVVFIY